MARLQYIDRDGAEWCEAIVWNKATIGLSTTLRFDRFVDLPDGRGAGSTRALDKGTFQNCLSKRRAGNRKACAYQGTCRAEKDEQLFHALPPRDAIGNRFTGIVTEPYIRSLSFNRSIARSQLMGGALRRDAPAAFYRVPLAGAGAHSPNHGPRRVNRRIPKRPGSTLPRSSALDGSGTAASPSLWKSRQVAVFGSSVVQGSTPKSVNRPFGLIPTPFASSNRLKQFVVKPGRPQRAASPTSVGAGSPRSEPNVIVVHNSTEQFAFGTKATLA